MSIKHMKIISTKFEGLKLVKIDNFNDPRGEFVKIFQKKNFFSRLNINECYISFSKKGAVRGLHGQSGKFSQEKFIYCINGKALDIAVDLRKKSKTYGRIFKRIISRKNKKAIFIPKGFVHGLISLEKDTIIINFSSNHYNPNKEFGVNIKSLNLKLPILKLFFSNKDKNLPKLKDII